MTADELKYLFSGAPHFLLEKGKHTQWVPLVIFPWDNDAAIDRLRDRKLLIHPSFTLSTLHAHLPVFWTHVGVMVPTDPRDRKGSKRASFDVGVFEVPNMLSMMTDERGTIGFANYLELPVSDFLQYRQPPEFPKPAGELADIPKDPYYIECNPSIPQDRLRIIQEGPIAWRRLGIRDCSMKSITERLQRLSEIRDTVLENSKSQCLLDVESVEELHHNLFSNFLFPPPRMLVTQQPNLKAQINILVRVLGVPGAWVDFSLVEWRIRAAQILWERSPHHDGDCLNTPSRGGQESVDVGDERKWLLIQLLLASELSLRFDAAVRRGVMTHSHEFTVTPQDIQVMHSLRTPKTDWDVLFARRFFDNMSVHFVEDKSQEIVKERPPSPRSKLRMKFGMKASGSVRTDQPAWSCVLTPRHSKRQLGGLLAFARWIQWPNLDQLKDEIVPKVQKMWNDPAYLARMFGTPTSTKPLPEGALPLTKKDMYDKRRTRQLAQLQMPPDIESTEYENYLGGWVSRSWFSGLVLPGEPINHLLMCTILENDPVAMSRLGPIANLYGGFIYQNRTWWNKMCIVGRILACLDGASECMGWTSLPMVPQFENGQPLSDGWLEIEARDDLEIRAPRIYDGARVLHESSPLGAEGHLIAKAFSLLQDSPEVNPEPAIEFQRLILYPVEDELPQQFCRPFKAHAFLAFSLTSPIFNQEVIFPLSHNSRFISSFPCIPPRGVAVVDDFIHHDQLEDHLEARIAHIRRQARRYAEANNGRRPSLRLPGHLLHMASYPYSLLSLESLPNIMSFPFSSAPMSRANTTEDARYGTPSWGTSTPGSPAPSTPMPGTPPYPPPPAAQLQPSFESIFSSLLAPPKATEPPPNQRNRHHTRSKSAQAPPKHQLLSSAAARAAGHAQPPRTTYIIDARGGAHREIFARAWCASVGANAVVGRVGRTCLSCCVREARAANVDVVIRVGTDRDRVRRRVSFDSSLVRESREAAAME